MAPSVRAVFFDFDGTLADSYAAIAASVNHVRRQNGMEDLSVHEVKRHVGRGPEYLLTHTVPGCNVPRAIASYRAHHPSVMYELTTLLPGAREAIERLHGAGLGLAVCSNKPRTFTERLMDHLRLGSMFRAILGPDDVPRPKPAPDMLLEGLRRLGTPAADALYIGDMAVDIETGRAAGVRVWAVPTGSDTRKTLEEARPERVLESLADLAGGLGL